MEKKFSDSTEGVKGLQKGRAEGSKSDEKSGKYK